MFRSSLIPHSFERPAVKAILPTTMASAVFFLDLKGKASSLRTLHPKRSSNTLLQTLLARNYRGDIPMSAVEKFPVLLSEAEEESSAVPPCFSDEGINVHPRRDVAMRAEKAADSCRPRLDSISTFAITIFSCSPSPNATPTLRRFSFFCTKSSRSSRNTSRSSRKNRYGITSSLFTSCWMR